MTKSEYDTTHTLWPTFAFHYKYKDFVNDKTQLVSDIYEASTKHKFDIDSGVAKDAKSNVLESKFNFLDTDTVAIKKLNDFFYDSFNHMITKALPGTGFWRPEGNIHCNIRESWYHITNNKGYHTTHVHPGSSWAGIFYVQCKECDMVTRNGINTWYNFNSSQGCGDSGDDWINNAFAYRIPPMEGHLIIFPAWIPHDAIPYEGTEDRIVVSVNTNFFYR